MPDACEDSESSERRSFANRVSQILDTFNRDDRTLSGPELVRRTGLPKSTTTGSSPISSISG